MSDKRRASDFPDDFHVVEEIVLTWNDHHTMNHKETKKTDITIKKLLENIVENDDYHCIKVSELNSDNIENWDIIEIKFIKDFKEKSQLVTMRFFIKMTYSLSINWFIYISDEHTWFSSKARIEKISLPIYQWWKRRIELRESLEEAVIVSVNQYLHETRIKEIHIYREWELKEKWIKQIIRSKVQKLLKIA